MNKKRLIISLIFTISFGLTNACSAYVAPDWAEIARNNARQNPNVTPSYYNLQKEVKKNKKQKISKKLYKYNKQAEKKRNKKQKISKRTYKYDRQAEKARNALQKVK